MERFFNFLQKHIQSERLVRGRYKIHDYADLEEMLNDLHELDHQGKILLQHDEAMFTII